ncbi:hypothetical protein ACFW1A_37625, partial [Kitasatospora sp. NPDC058965]
SVVALAARFGAGHVAVAGGLVFSAVAAAPLLVPAVRGLRTVGPAAEPVAAGPGVPGAAGAGTGLG